ncbi:MAG: hypothetical protein R3B57_14150 [Phycisphaerales bacterium]
MHRCAIAIGVMAGTAPLALSGVVTLDFQTEDDLISPLVNGEVVSSPSKFGEMVAINGFGAHNMGAAIFNSSFKGPNTLGPDPDLLVGLGNILILQSPDHPTQSVAGVFDTPDDAAKGGTFVFNFMDPVELMEITLIDIDAGNHTLVTLLDTSGRSRIYNVPQHWTKDRHSEGLNGYQVLDLTTLASQLGEGGATATAFEDAGFDATSVRFFSIEMTGSGGVDNLTFVSVPTPGAALLLGAGGLSGLRRRRRV